MQGNINSCQTKYNIQNLLQKYCDHENKSIVFCGTRYTFENTISCKVV